MKKEKVIRLAPKKETLRALFAKSGNKCAFPGCQHPLIDEDNEFVAQVCHIEAAEEGGERFNEHQTNEMRRSFENLILLCYPHHVKTNDVIKYPTEKLKQIKADHELKYSSSGYVLSDLTLNKIYNDALIAIQEIKNTTEAILGHSIKADSDLEFIKAQLGILTSRATTTTAEEFPELQNIRDLRNSDKHSAALLVISSVKKNKWSSLSNDLKSRITVNEAICQLELGNSTKAAELFIETLKWNNDEHAFSHAAYGYSILGKSDEALKYIQKALEINPKNVNAYITLIQLNKDTKYEDLISKIPLEIQEIPEVCYNLGIVARNGGDFEKSIGLFQKAADNSTEVNPEYFGSLGSTIVESITRNTFSFVTKQIDNDSKIKAKYAIELLTKAWDAFKNTDVKNQHAWLLLNRGITKKLLLDSDGAYNDIREAYEILPDDYFFLRHFIIICYETKKIDEALSKIDKLIELSSESEINESLLLKAEFLLNTDKPNDAVLILNQVYKNSNNLEKRYKRQLEHSLITSYVRSGNTEGAIKFSEHLISEAPNEITPYIEAAILFYNLNKHEDSKKFAIEASAKVLEDTPPEELHELSHILFSHAVFDKGTSVLERITNTSVYSPLTKNLVKGYINIGQHKKALDLLKTLEEKYGLDRFITELLCIVYEAISDVKAAIQVCLGYLEINPDDQIMLIRLAFNYDWAANDEEVAKTLNKISKIDYTLHHDSLFKIAALFFKFNHIEKALDIAYETRRENFNIGNCHLKYFSLISEFNLNLADYEFNEVSRNTAVHLEIGQQSQTITYIIEERKDALIERGEVDISSALAIQLLQKKIGDSITIDKGIGTPQVCTIKGVQSKYLFAFQQTVSLLNTRFINEPGFQVFNTARTGNIKEDLKFIFEGLDESEKFDEQLNSLYKNHQVTIGFYARIKKINPIRAISILGSNSELGIFPVWLANEFPVARKLLDDGCNVTVDLTTIIVLANIGELNLLKKLSNKLIVSQSTFDAIKKQVQEMSGMASQGFMTVGKVNGQYVREVISPVQVKKHIEHLSNLLEWIKTNTSIEPCRLAINLTPEEKQSFDNLLGSCYIEAILTAKEQGGLLLSDESILRQLAANENSVRGFHTFVLITYLANKNLLSKDEIAELTIKLFSYNFKGLPSDEHILRVAAAKADYSPKYPFTLMIEGLGSPLISNKLATHISVNFLYSIYSDASIQIYSSLPISTVRQNLAMPVVSMLLQRDGFNVNQLVASIILKFSLLQPQKDELVALIRELNKHQV